MTDRVLQEIDPKFIVQDLDQKNHRDNHQNDANPDNDSDSGSEEEEDDEDEEEEEEENEEMKYQKARLIDEKLAKLYEESKRMVQEEQIAQPKYERPSTRSRSRSRPQPQKQIKTLELKPFDPTSISPDSTCLMVGKRRSGKSEAIKNILIWKNTPRIVVFGKGRDWKTWSAVVGNTGFIAQWNEAIFCSLLKLQAKLLKLKEMPGGENLNIELAIIIEDFSSDAKVMRSPAIADFLNNGRRLETLLIMSAQYLKHIVLGVRTQFDYFWCFKEKNETVRKHLCETVGNNFETKKEFYGVLDKTTKERRALVVHQTSDKDALDEIVKPFRARMYPPRKLGCFLSRLFDESFFKNSDEEDETIDQPLKAMLKMENPQTNAPKLDISDIGDIPIDEIERQKQKQNVKEIATFSSKNTDFLLTFSD